MELRARFQRHLAENETSDRSFGLLTSVVFLLFGLAPLMHGSPQRNWLLIGALDIVILAMIFPRSLRLAKHVWLFLGFLLASVINPIVLGVLFYFAITPSAWLLKLCGRDLLQLRF